MILSESRYPPFGIMLLESVRLKWNQREPQTRSAPSPQMGRGSAPSAQQRCASTPTEHDLIPLTGVTDDLQEPAGRHLRGSDVLDGVIDRYVGERVAAAQPVGNRIRALAASLRQACCQQVGGCGDEHRGDPGVA